MRKEGERRGASFKVVCAWCGATIRRAGSKDAQGMCPACHARMLREHLRAHRGHTFEKASER